MIRSRASLLASAVLVLGLLLAVLVSGLAYRAEVRKAQTLVDRLTSETAQRAVDATARLASEPALVMRAVAASMSSGLVDPDVRAVESEFLRVAALVPAISSLRFAGARGDGVIVERRADGGFTTWLREGDGTYRGFEVGSPGDRSRPIAGERDVDMRGLPWYRIPAQSGKHAWSAVEYDGSRVPVMTFGVPVGGPRGALAGVVAADLVLAPLGELLHDLAADGRLAVYVMERDGALIAASTEAGSASGASDRRQAAVASHDGLVSASAAEVLRRLGSGDASRGLFFREPDLAGDLATVAARALRIDNGPEWIVVVASPRDAVTAGALGHAAAGGAAVLAFVLGIIAIGMSLVRSHRSEMARLHGRPLMNAEAPGGSARDAATDEVDRASARVRTLEVVVEQSGEAIVLGDAEGRIEFANRAFERLTGYSAEEIRGQPIARLQAEAGEPSSIEEALATVRQRGVFRGVLASRGHAGREFFADVTMSPVEGASGEVTGFVAILRDATERVKREAEIHYLAKFDALTRLPNRVSLLEHMQSITRAGRRERDRNLKAAVLYIDLDDFKPVNDRFGHHEGDLVLAEVADRLRSELRADDMVARVGGDEFVAVLDSVTDLASALKVANKIIEAIEAPIIVNGVPVRVTASVGLAMYPDHGVDAFYLIKLADAAMYVAKEQGGGKVAVCRPGSDSDVEPGRWIDHDGSRGRADPARYPFPVSREARGPAIGASGAEASGSINAPQARRE